LPAFFALVHAHTMEGLFADPIYGGNRDFAGWRAVGYPGAYYVYTEEEQQSFEPLDKPFQSIADL
jgi:gluconate 2-dehydrogenase gamma chain